MDYSKLLAILFNFSMALWFVYSFLFPVETGYWLIYSGLSILILEFFSVFIIVFLGSILKKETGWRSSGVDSGEQKSKIPGIFMLLLLVLMAGAFTVILNVWLFVYFVFSMGVKAVAMFFKTSAQEEGVTALKTGVAIVLSAFGAIFFSFFTLLFTPQQNLFREEISRLSAELLNSGVHISGAAFDNPGFTAFWGILYFLILLFFEINPPRHAAISY